MNFYYYYRVRMVTIGVYSFVIFVVGDFVIEFIIYALLLFPFILLLRRVNVCIRKIHKKCITHQDKQQQQWAEEYKSTFVYN